MAWAMTTLPSWPSAEVRERVAEPFRSNDDFWSSLAASADALVTLAAAVAVGVVLAITGQRWWALAPFAVPAGLAVRAALVGRASHRQSQGSFGDRREWRDAERHAVATAFVAVLWRPRRRARG